MSPADRCIRSNTPAAVLPAAQLRIGPVFWFEYSPIPMLPFYHRNLTAIRPKPYNYPQSLNTIGDHLRMKRLELGLTHRDTAKIFEVNVSTVESWENHRYIPQEKNIAQIIQFLGYNPYPPGTTIGEQLFYYRMVHGLSAVSVGKKLGVDDYSILRWEAGLSAPREKHELKIRELIQTDGTVLEGESEK